MLADRLADPGQIADEPRVALGDLVEDGGHVGRHIAARRDPIAEVPVAKTTQSDEQPIGYHNTLPIDHGRAPSLPRLMAFGTDSDTLRPTRPCRRSGRFTRWVGRE